MVPAAGLGERSAQQRLITAHLEASPGCLVVYGPLRPNWGVRTGR